MNRFINGVLVGAAFTVAVNVTYTVVDLVANRKQREDLKAYLAKQGK